MKKWQKILLSACVLIFSLLVIFVSSLLLILEPKIKINGFAEMNKNILDNIDNKIIYIDNSDNIIKDNTGITSVDYCRYEDFPKALTDAFVSIEDKRFFAHNGVDYIRIFGALLHNIEQGKIVEGGSTITQQLVKNTHLTPQKSFKRKIQEIRIAKEIERNYSKEEILEMYLNILYFGNNIYGISNAAQAYFDSDVKDLSAAQCAVLAAIINNPSIYNPYTASHALEKRKNIVLQRMYELKFLDDSEYREALNEKIDIKARNFVYNHFFEFAYNEIIEKTGNKNPSLSSPLTVKTTLNRVYQEKIEEVLQKNLPNENNIMAQAILLENSTGKILAYAATETSDYLNMKRQLGSTIKPILCYAPCLEKKLIYPCSPVLDEPTAFENNFNPKNYKEIYKGWISAQEALAISSNVCAVKLLEVAGIEDAKKFAEKTGLKFDINDNGYHIALGATKNGNRLLEIANAYQMLGNGGKMLPCTFIEEIRSDNGKLLYTYRRKEKKVMDNGNAFLLNSMLRQCVKTGTAKKLKSCQYAVAAKTGTVGTKEGNTDAYCIAYGQDYTLAVWVGSKNGYMSNEISGGTLPTVIARNILNILELDMKEFDMPENIIKLNIDKQEYEQNHKVMLENGLIPPRETIGCYFHIENIPKGHSKKYISEYLLNMDKLNFYDLNIA